MIAEGIEGRIQAEIAKAVVRREREAELLLVALLAHGHALLEGVPGVSKTLLAKTFSQSVGLEFRRVQFTPDMLPLDILGGFIFNVKDREFEFRKGPVFTNILLADEINRAPPKVQSALLEAMQEQQVTLEGHTEPLPSPHMVVATQNPLEFQGVYPLPEGQLDRFMLKITLGYPSPEIEAAIIRRNLTDTAGGGIQGVLSRQDLSAAFQAIGAIRVSDEMLAYLSNLATATRTDPRISLGASPRAMVQLAQCSRALAFLRGRDYLLPDDVKQLVVSVLSHRVRLDETVVATGESRDVSRILVEIADKVRPPR